MFLLILKYLDPNQEGHRIRIHYGSGSETLPNAVFLGRKFYLTFVFYWYDIELRYQYYILLTISN